MHTGRLIEELIETVERAERHARQQVDSQEVQRWYAVTPYELGTGESNLLGVA
jgi:hypothetical protein